MFSFFHWAGAELIEHAISDVGEKKVLKVHRVVTTGSYKENVYHTLLVPCIESDWMLCSLDLLGSSLLSW